MISPQQWDSLRFLSQADFNYPEKMVWDTVSNLDTAASMVGTRPLILSDFRPDERLTSQHRHGRAIDTTWPGQNPLRVWNVLRGAEMFSGLGVYVNEQGVASFHTDTRPERSAADPALWGGNITHKSEYDGGPIVRATAYVAAADILDIIKKKAPAALTILAVGFLLWWWTSRRR